jgi:hypothetical protein
LTMLMNRAYEILESLRLHENVGIAQEEQDELLASHLINVYTESDHEDMKNASREVDSLTQNVRDLSRQLSADTGPISTGRLKPRRRGTDALREKYQFALAKLEEAVGKKTVFDVLVFNSPTRSYISLALVGRKAITDMKAWRSRFGDEELSAFIGRMVSMRSSMESAVNGANVLVDKFMSPRPGMIKPELRGPALIASQAGVDADEFEGVFANTPESDGLEEEDYPEEDELFRTTFLTSETGGEDYLTSKFYDARASIRGTDLESGNMSLKAAAIADLPADKKEVMLERMKWLKTNMTLPDENDTAWLAQSNYPTDLVKKRYDDLNSAVVALGYQENSDLRTACAIMAGSAQPVDVLTSRFETLVNQLKYVFDSTYVAAAMLASNPLEPDEAMHVFKEAVGVISRANYFDDAGEVENLALLLTNRYDANAQPVPIFPQRATQMQAQAAPSEEEQRKKRTTPWYYWYYWHNRYYGRPMYWSYRMHPGHMHTVPHFG